MTRLWEIIVPETVHCDPVHLSCTLNCLWLQTVIVVGCLGAVGSHNRIDHHSLPVGSWDSMDQVDISYYVPLEMNAGAKTALPQVPELPLETCPGFCGMGFLAVGEARLFDLVFQLIFAVDWLTSAMEERSVVMVMLLPMGDFLQGTVFKSLRSPTFHCSCKPAKVTLPSCSTHPCPLSRQQYRFQ